MAAKGIPEQVRQFIFGYIDSVEQLDILLLLYAHPEKSWSAQEIANTLRTNAVSVANRIGSLISSQVVTEVDATLHIFRYQPQNAAAAETIANLSEANKVHRHTVLALIFSPLKRARNFADAFTIKGPTRNGGNDG